METLEHGRFQGIAEIALRIFFLAPRVSKIVSTRLCNFFTLKYGVESQNLSVCFASTTAIFTEVDNFCMLERVDSKLGKSGWVFGVTWANL